MNDTMIDRNAAAKTALTGFSQHYNYDVTAMEELLEASPGAFHAFFGAAQTLGQFRGVAPKELLAIVKIATVRAEDCGPCLELALKMMAEEGVENPIIQGALHGGKGLSPEYLEVHDYARAVTLNQAMDPDCLPRLRKRWGEDVMAELAVTCLAAGLYPAIKRALGHAKSCSLFPALNS